MRVLFVLLLSVPAWSRHIIEGPIGEIAEATQAVTRLDRELASPQATPERRAEAQAARSGQVERIANVAAAHPANAEVNIAAASNLVRVNEPIRAEQAAERAVVAAPQNPDGYLHRGQARMAQGKFEDAVKDFQAVLQRRPGDPVATAGLKLSEGRTSIAAASKVVPQPNTTIAEQMPPSSPITQAPAGLSEFDRRAAEKKRVQDESLGLYNASKMAQAAGNWQEAIDNANKALALSPQSTFLSRHQDAVKQAYEEAKRPKPITTMPATAEAKPIGSANFLGGFLHYTGKSGKARRVNFNEIDTSAVRVRDFPEPAGLLKWPAREDTRKIDSTIKWTAKRAQWLFLGTISLRLRGTLKIRADCHWQFEGSLRAWDDKYDFNASKRGMLGEALTAIGRNTPGEHYTVEIRGVKPIRESGELEKCE